MNKLELQKKANDVRKGIIEGVHAAKAGHPGGSLSSAEVFTYLYFEEMNIDPKNPKDPDRDRFVLSKGHTAPGLYSVLANRGYFPVSDLLTLRQIGSHLQGHPCIQHTPGIDMSSGSLGQGISAACEIDGAIDEVNSPYPIDKKFEAFNFHVINVADGNDFDQLAAAFKEARETKGVPTAIIMKTVKGKGVSFMENQAGWHGKAPNDEQYAVAMEELKKVEEELCQK